MTASQSEELKIEDDRRQHDTKKKVNETNNNKL